MDTEYVFNVEVCIEIEKLRKQIKELEKRITKLEEAAEMTKIEHLEEEWFYVK